MRLENGVPFIEEVTPEYQAPTESRAQKAATYANKLLIGLGHGGLFFFTNAAGVATLCDKNNMPYGATIALGGFAGLLSASTNAMLAPKATHELFTWRPELWLLTAATFFTIGVYAALPIAAAVMQSMDPFEKHTGIHFSAAKSAMGNLAAITTGIAFSTGLVNRVNDILTIALAEKFPSLRIERIKKFEHGQRSIKEYEQLIGNTDNINKLQFSALNILITMISFVPAVLLSVSVAPEEKEAIDLNLWILNFVMPMKKFAGSSFGSKSISIATYGFLNASFAQEGIRTSFRDFYNIFANDNKCINAFSWTLLATFVSLTLMTTVFQGIESQDPTAMITLAAIGVFFINYPGPRQFFFCDHSVCATEGSAFKKENNLKNHALKLIEEEKAQVQAPHSCFSWFYRRPSQPLADQAHLNQHEAGGPDLL